MDERKPKRPGSYAELERPPEQVNAIPAVRQAPRPSAHRQSRPMIEPVTMPPAAAEEFEEATEVFDARERPTRRDRPSREIRVPVDLPATSTTKPPPSLETTARGLWYFSKTGPGKAAIGALLVLIAGGGANQYKGRILEWLGAAPAGELAAATKRVAALEAYRVCVEDREARWLAYQLKMRSWSGAVFEKQGVKVVVGPWGDVPLDPIKWEPAPLPRAAQFGSALTGKQAPAPLLQPEPIPTPPPPARDLCGLAAVVPAAPAAAQP